MRKIDVLIPSRDRVDNLRRCLNSIRERGYFSKSNVEFTLIDNSQEKCNREIYKNIAREYSISYLRVDIPGISHALNNGILNTRNPIIVFLDDDTVVQDGWVENLVDTLADDEIIYVSGKMTPYKLDTKAERLFEKKGGLDKRHNKIEKFNMDIFRKKYPVRFPPIYCVALGGYSAVKRVVFESVGGFDINFGVGSYIGAGNMGEFCCRLIFNNYTVAHNPNAVIYHCHRESMKELFDVRVRYAQADTAIMLKYYHSYGSFRGLLTAFMYHPWKRLLQGFFLKGYPFRLVVSEFVGNWLGIYKYISILINKG